MIELSEKVMLAFADKDSNSGYSYWWVDIDNHDREIEKEK